MSTAVPPRPITHDIQIRVRYGETDQGGILYHGNYFTYFEVGRTEMSRHLKKTYREIEASGLFGVVAKAECSYKKPAKYDDVLTIRTTIQRVTRVKIEYEHLALRDGEVIAVGHITLAFVDRNGVIQRVPDWILGE